MSLKTPFPIQAAGVKSGADIVYGLLDDLLSEGVSGANDLAVVQNPLGANLSVTVNAGSGYVEVISGGKRRILNDAASNSGAPGALNATDWETTFTAPHATLPRIDRVVATVYDSNVDGGSGKYAVKFRVIPGAASAGATLANLTGAAAVPDNSILLANVLVAAAATSIVTAQIDTALRSRASIGSGVLRTPLAVMNGAGQSIPNAAWTLCQFSAYVVQGEVRAASHAISFPSLGYFSVSALPLWVPNGSGGRGLRFLRYNAAGVLQETSLVQDETAQLAAVSQGAAGVARVMGVAATDYVQVEAFQSSGAPIVLSALSVTAVRVG